MPHQWPCIDFATKARGKHAAILWISNGQSTDKYQNGVQINKTLSRICLNQFLRICSLISKDQNWNINCTMVDVRGDVLRPSHCTTPAAVKVNKNTKVRSFKSNEHTRNKVDGQYFEVSAKTASSVTLWWLCNNTCCNFVNFKYAVDFKDWYISKWGPN